MDERKNEIMSANQEFGKALIEQAKEKYDKNRNDSVMNAVVAEMKLRDEAVKVAINATMQVDYYKRVLAAIENGEFSFSVNDTMVFNDKDLRLGHWQP